MKLIQHYGLTLVELLIGLTLGIILIWGGDPDFCRRATCLPRVTAF